MTSTTDLPSDDSLKLPRLERARQIATDRDLWGPLHYMDNCPIGNGEDGGDPDAVRRYMIVTSTEGGEDGWIEFKKTPAEVRELLEGLLTDEWGLVGVWDLGDMDGQPVQLSVVPRIDVLPSKEGHEDE
jgi:hypothetical protein